MEKYLLLNLDIQNGEYEHQHTILLSTRCTNLEFAVQYYIAHFWSDGYHSDGKWWWNGGELACKRYSYKEVEEADVPILKSYLQ